MLGDLFRTRLVIDRFRDKHSLGLRPIEIETLFFRSTESHKAYFFSQISQVSFTLSGHIILGAFPISHLFFKSKYRQGSLHGNHLIRICIYVFGKHSDTFRYFMKDTIFCLSRYSPFVFLTWYSPANALMSVLHGWWFSLSNLKPLVVISTCVFWGN